MDSNLSSKLIQGIGSSIQTRMGYANLVQLQQQYTWTDIPNDKKVAYSTQIQNIPVKSKNTFLLLVLMFVDKI